MKLLKAFGKRLGFRLILVAVLAPIKLKLSSTRGATPLGAVGRTAHAA